MNNDGVILEIRAESIYMHTISTLSFHSVAEFEVGLSSEIIQIFRGCKKGETKRIKSIQIDDNIFSVELSVIGIFREKTIIYDNDKLGNHYGTRFYPFVSSEIKEVVSCTKTINYVILILPDTLSPIFNLSSIYQNSQKSADIRHSREKDCIKYIFCWEKELKGDEDKTIVFNIPLKYGGTSILRMVEFPICYWIIALIGIALLYDNNVRIVTGAIVSSLLFMLQRWNKSFVPQRNTLLTHLYFLYGGILAVWGYSWKLFGLWALFLCLPIIFVLYLTLKNVSIYSKYGKLTKWFSEKYAKVVIFHDDGYSLKELVKKTFGSFFIGIINVVERKFSKNVKSKDDNYSNE